MKTYELIIPKNRDFAISLDGKEIGRAEYAKWYSSTPEFKTVDGTVYTLKSKNFWKGTQEVIRNGKPSLLLKRGFTGYTVIPYGREHHFYKISHRGGFKNGLRIGNYKGEKLAELTVKFTFKSFSTAYTISAIDEYGETELEQFLLSLMIYHYKENQRAATYS